LYTLHRTNASDWVAFTAFVVAALTDGLDGYAARKMDLVSNAGQLWDPIADKVLVTAAMIGLVVVGRFPSWAAAIIIVREILVTGLRLYASAKGRGFAASRAGKAKTGAQLVAVLLFLLPVSGIWTKFQWGWLALALFLTVVSGLDYFRRAPEILKA
ncbi:MAG: CDP-diacylglycerol--glycerol-3-phosphate 3-phosphatidyltransferase, partial [Actinobacteria bacterium]|nr:CDP-diacylglycerol--glycerol-3-phosphate 3-phosphatidyltransferase [Actinomycetota bacterium]